MSSLFEKTAINNMTLNNRFVRSATFESMANPDGSCTSDLIRLTRDLAEGEVGLIITGYAFTSEIGKSRPTQTGVHNDSMIDGLNEMAEAAHAADGAIAMQIAHCGCNSFVMPEGEEAIGPSPISMPQGCRCRDMTISEVKETINDFVSAAIRVKNAGFDGVQLHGAHGYLISQFLSPFYNKRTDEYGGSVENRARFLLEILREIRSAIGSDYPVLVKINSDDFLEDGFVKDEMIQVAIMLEQEGIDAIEISGGTHLSPDEYSFSRKTGIVSEEKELYFKEAAKLYKEKIKVPLMLVGGIRSLNVAEKVVDEGLADYVSLCRPLIREPHLIRRWKSGDIKRATCISCNECFKPVRAGKGLYCVAEAKLKAKKERK
ncbi:MAG TPA: NADH:flavin oxidoreductase [Deltaproteobacteria bacterium]|nr:NADH:flavin oxidoreductase [Deltaproteobacteria bacterium]